MDKVGVCMESRICDCDMCGKRFFVPIVGMYVYKRPGYWRDECRELYFCGWNCMRKYDAEVEKKREERREATRKRVAGRYAKTRVN